MSERPQGEAESSSIAGSGNFTRVADARLKTVPIRPEHRITDFRCQRSPRVEGFFVRDMPRLVARGYCRVFILPDPADATGVWGYYTLSPAQIDFESLTKNQQRQIIGHMPIPLMRVGFMGRDDRVPKEYELGKALLVDAARRVHCSEDITAWGLILEAEGGLNNVKLYNWYRDTMKFTAIRDSASSETASLYCPLRRLLPELQQSP